MDLSAVYMQLAEDQSFGCVNSSASSESNSNFRYLRCWRILLKYFLFLKNTQISSLPTPSLSQSNKSQRNLKSKIHFQNKMFSLNHRRSSCLLLGHSVRIYPLYVFGEGTSNGCAILSTTPLFTLRVKKIV